MKFNFFETGTVKVEVIVFKREQLLNILWNNGIKIHNIKKIDVSTIIMEIDYKDYRSVKDVVKKLQGKITIVSTSGGIFVVSKIKKRIGIVIGLALFLGLLYYLSGFIWRIEIDTNRFLAPYEVRQQLKEIGIKPGISKDSLDVYSLEKTMENLNSDIMWVNARKEGSTLKIKIEEKINPPLKDELDKIETVTATMDGEIKKIFTTSGTAAVKPGDIVKKGDVLILPQEGKEGFQYEVPAKGKVVANTFYEKIIEVQVSGEKEERTGEIDSEIYLEFNNKKIYLKKPIKAFKTYDKIEEVGKYIHKNIYFEKVSKDITEPKEEVINKAIDFLYTSTIKEVTKQAKLVDKVVTTEDLGEGKILLKVLFIIEQDIALNY